MYIYCIEQQQQQKEVTARDIYVYAIIIILVDRLCD